MIKIPSGLLSQRYGYFSSMAVVLELTVKGGLFEEFGQGYFPVSPREGSHGDRGSLFFKVATTFVLNLFDPERRREAKGSSKGSSSVGRSWLLLYFL